MYQNIWYIFIHNYTIFYFDIFYNKIDGVNQNAIKIFIEELFDIEGLYSKADLQILTEIYKLLDKNLVIK
jgi:hypothetical protein